MTRPGPTEAAPYYATYIDQVPDGDILELLDTQMREVSDWLSAIPEARSGYRYAEGKWSVREVLNHINDTERLFAFRALWFARGFAAPLPSFDQNTAVAAARAGDMAWPALVAEFRAIRTATTALFRMMPAEAWERRGVASEKPFSVRALAYIAAGHVYHHMKILRERYGLAGQG